MALWSGSRLPRTQDFKVMTLDGERRGEALNMNRFDAAKLSSQMCLLKIRPGVGRKATPAYPCPC